MLFTSHAIKLLTEDHKNIRTETNLMRNLNIPQTERKQAFARLLPHLMSHIKNEEKVVYSFMKLCDQDELRIWALEGREEHLLVDQLVKKMLSVDISSEEWSAKGKVLAELIDHHIEEEENEIFPAMAKEINEDSDQRMTDLYENHNKAEALPRPITKDSSVNQPYR